MNTVRTRNDLDEKIRAQSIEILRTPLAESVDIALQFKQAHWNIKGPQFIALHEFFDRAAKDFRKYGDLIAERIVQLGGTAEGTLQEVVGRSKLPAYPLRITSCHEHLQALVQTVSVYGELARKSIENADRAGDKDTADIFTQVSRGSDMYLWMLESHLHTER